MTDAVNPRLLFHTAVGRLLVALGFIVGVGCGSTSGDDSLSYLAFGASDAVGVGAVSVTNDYVYQVGVGAERGNGRPIKLYNLASRGATIGDLRNRDVAIPHPQDVSLISIATGTNDLIDGDSVEEFEAQLRLFLEALREESPSAVILIASVPNLSSFAHFARSPDPDVTAQRVLDFNSAIARQAVAVEALLVDLYPLSLEDSNVSEWEGFYPSSIGHQIMANAFIQVLRPYVQSL